MSLSAVNNIIVVTKILKILWILFLQGASEKRDSEIEERQRVTERDSESARERKSVRETETERSRTRVRAREGASERERDRGDVVWCSIGADVVGVV